MNKTVIVTGANVGHTGHAIAARFAREGYDVVLTCRKQEAAALGEAVMGELRLLYPRGDPGG